MIIGGIRYCLYMIKMRFRGFKYEKLKRTESDDIAESYVNNLLDDWINFTNKITKLNIESIGAENIPDGPCVFVANHQSILDIPSLYSTNDKNIKFIGKKELLNTPFIGYWIKNGLAIPLDRDNPKEAIKTMNEALEYLKKGYSIGIFPEGTRSVTGEVLDFKKGSFKIATRSKLPVVPVTIIGSDLCFKSKFKIKPSNVKVIYGEPIFTENLSTENAKNIHNIAREIIINNKNKYEKNIQK